MCCRFPGLKVVRGPIGPKNHRVPTMGGGGGDRDMDIIQMMGVGDGGASVRVFSWLHSQGM